MTMILAISFVIFCLGIFTVFGGTLAVVIFDKLDQRKEKKTKPFHHDESP